MPIWQKATRLLTDVPGFPNPRPHTTVTGRDTLIAMGPRKQLEALRWKLSG